MKVLLKHLMLWSGMAPFLTLEPLVRMLTILALITFVAILTSRPRNARAESDSHLEASFAPTISNGATAPGPAPHGMVWIPGGDFSMGTADPRGTEGGGMLSMEDARPIHRVYVDGFWMDATDVTN